MILIIYLYALVGFASSLRNQTMHLGAHNAGSYGSGMTELFGVSLNTSIASNQNITIYEQLVYGVRYLDYDTCFTQHQVYSCHNSVFFNTLRHDFDDVIRFMNENPDELIFLHFNRDVEENKETKIADEINRTLSGVKTMLIPIGDSIENGVPRIKKLMNQPGRLVVLLTNELYKHIPDELKQYVLNANNHLTIIYRGFTIFLNYIVNEEEVTAYILQQCQSAQTPFIDLQLVGSYGISIEGMAEVLATKAGYLLDVCNEARRNGTNYQNEDVWFFTVDYVQYFDGVHKHV